MSCNYGSDCPVDTYRYERVLCESDFERSLLLENLLDHLAKCHLDVYLTMTKKVSPVSEPKKEPEVPNICQRLEVPFKSAWFITFTNTTKDFNRVYNAYKHFRDSKHHAFIATLSCVELTKDGKPHIHALFYSSKPYGITWSHARGHQNCPDHIDIQKPKDIDSVIKYIMKLDTKPNYYFLFENNLSSYIIDNSILKDGDGKSGSKIEEISNA